LRYGSAPAAGRLRALKRRVATLSV